MASAVFCSLSVESFVEFDVPVCACCTAVLSYLAYDGMHTVRYSSEVARESGRIVLPVTVGVFKPTSVKKSLFNNSVASIGQNTQTHTHTR